VANRGPDKEGFLRSEAVPNPPVRRAARNVDGTVLMYADTVTDSMKRAISETERRRGIQEEYNREHGIDPQTIRKKVSDILLSMTGDPRRAAVPGKRKRSRSMGEGLPREELERLIRS